MTVDEASVFEREWEALEAIALFLSHSTDALRDRSPRTRDIGRQGLALFWQECGVWALLDVGFWRWAWVVLRPSAWSRLQ